MSTTEQIIVIESALSHRPTRAAFGSNAAQIGRRFAHSSARAPDDRRLPAPVRTRARDVEA
jgi:hypothetical protein